MYPAIEANHRGINEKNNFVSGLLYCTLLRLLSNALVLLNYLNSIYSFEIFCPLGSTAISFLFRLSAAVKKTTLTLLVTRLFCGSL